MKFEKRIFDILLRFRAYPIAFTADVEKTFLMISLAPEDQEFVRSLWVDNPFENEPKLQVLRFARLVFGVSSSPFLLSTTVCYHLESHIDSHKELVDKILRPICVDDVVSGAHSEEETYATYGVQEFAQTGWIQFEKIC